MGSIGRCVCVDLPNTIINNCCIGGLPVDTTGPTPTSLTYACLFAQLTDLYVAITLQLLVRLTCFNFWLAALDVILPQ